MILQNEIRILYLLPHSGESDALIKCDLRVVSLEHNPDFEALSYVWGKRDCLVDIEVSDRKVGVTENLYSALRRVQLMDEARPLWIDQLCINQWDIMEKAQQVRLMRHIYTQCKNCLIWMGEIQRGVTEADADGALGILKYMAEVSMAANEESVALPYCLDSDASFEGPIKALGTMSIEGNPWWARVWTVQEAVLPSNKILLWGPFALSWEILRKASKAWIKMNLNRLGERFKEDSQREMMGGLMANVIWLDIATRRDDSPAFLVSRWRFREATDPRDKIYALMGLCSSGSMPRMESCNYNTSVVDVFCNLTSDLMQSERSLFPLIMDPRLEAEKATPGIPRWALDVSHISEWNHDWFHLYAWPRYNAHGKSVLDLTRILSRWEETAHTLELEGVFVDTIEIVGEPWLHSQAPRVDRHQLMLEKLREWEVLAREHVKRGTPESSDLYPGGYSIREAFGRLMLGDLLRNSEQWVVATADEEDVESVYQFMSSGKRYWTDRTVEGMMSNQRFFITKTGLMGIGHMDTQPGEEVWAFHGGNFPFTVIPRGGVSEEHYDFGGRCYVQGIMNGEAFESGKDTRILVLH